MGKSTYTFEVLIGAKTTPGYYANINKAMKGFNRFTGITSKAAKLASSAFVASNIVRGVKDVVEVYGEFEQAMANTSAVANATVSEYERMETAARYAGRTTTKTATESAEALGYMALAGWDVNSSTKALLPVLKLSEATGAELQSTSDLVTDSMGAMQLQIQDLDGYMDKLVATNNNANVTAEMLMQSLIRTGGSATTLGVSLDDTITAIGILGSSGIKAEKSGTALNAIFNRLANNSAAHKRLEKLGVDIFDTNGNFIGLEETLKRVSKAMEGLPEEQRMAALADLGGTHHSSKLAYLINSVAEGADGAASSWDKLQGSIENSEGALNRMNKRATDTLPAAAERLNSAFNDMKIEAVDVFGDDMTRFIDGFAEQIPEASEAIGSFFQDNRLEILEFGETLEDFASGAGGVLIDFFQFLIDNQGVVTGLLTTLAVKNSLGGLVEGVGGLAGALKKAGGFLPAISAFLGPGGLLVGGAAAAAGAIVGIKTAIDQTNESMANSSLEEHFGSLSLTLSEIEEAADSIMGMDLADAFNEQKDALSGLGENLDQTYERLSKLNWKIDTGIELNSDDVRDYEDSAKSLLEDTTNYLNEQMYTTQKAAMMTYGDNTKAAEAFMKNVQGAYGDVGDELEKTGKDLGKLLDKALADGVIDENDDKLVKKIRKKIEKINQIKAEIEKAESDARAEVEREEASEEFKGNGISADSFIELSKKLDESREEKDQTALDAKIQEYSSANLIKDEGKRQEAKDAADSAYRNSVMENELESANYKTTELSGAYSEEITDTRKKVQSQYRSVLSQMFNDATAKQGSLPMGMRNIERTIGSLDIGVDDSTKQAMSKIYESLEPDKARLDQIAQEYKDEGKEVPKAITQGINDISAIGLIAGQSSGMWSEIAATIASDPSMMSAYESLKAQGQKFPEELNQAIEENKDGATSGLDSLYSSIEAHAQETFSNPIEVEQEVKVTYSTTEVNQPATSGLPALVNNAKSKKTAKSNTGTTTGGSSPGGNPNSGKVKKHALGGIVPSPILTTFAEDGPEAAIPLDGSSRAKGLWERAGAALGMGQSMAQNVSTSSLNYSPNITIQGNADQNDVAQALSIGYEDFRRMMQQYDRENSRRSFAGA